MKTTFGRLFSVTALIVLVAVVGMGASFRALVKNYLIDEREEDLRATAAAVAELAANARHKKLHALTSAFALYISS